ncbi:substrate-binding domain-containing protein [Streptomyces niveus]
MAVGALGALRRRGLRIGSDVDLVAFDDIEWFSELDPPLTVVSHDAQAMGSTAMRLLLDVIEGRTPESVVLPTRLVVRESSGGARRQA